jgi:hypothetical protein
MLKNKRNQAQEGAMKKWMIPMLAVGLWLVAGGAQAEHRLGLGANYWVAVDDIKIQDIDKDGLSYLVSYQWRPALIGLQADVEFLPDLFGKDGVAPAAYVLVGKAIYAALGAGMIHLDGGWLDDPFIALKVGLDLELLPSLFLDISASYRYHGTIRELDVEDELKKIDTDTVFLGAAARIAF